jgi:hypothetical protein
LLDREDQAADAALASLGLPAQFVVSTCGLSPNGEPLHYDGEAQFKTLIGLAEERNYTLVVIEVGEFEPRKAEFAAAFASLVARGVRVISAPLGHPHDVAVLLRVLGRAAAGIHCTLHGLVMQMAMERPAFGVNLYKYLDSLDGAGLSGLQLLHSVPNYAFSVVNAVEHADQWAATLHAFNEATLRRHVDAMRDFARNLIWQRHPEVGKILSCALPWTNAQLSSWNYTVEIRSFMAHEGAVIDVVLRRVRK